MQIQKEEYRRLLQLEGSRGQGYPDGEALKWFLETSQMPDHLRRHSEAVSRKALSMAVKLQEKRDTPGFESGSVRFPFFMTSARGAQIMQQQEQRF